MYIKDDGFMILFGSKVELVITIVRFGIIFELLSYRLLPLNKDTKSKICRVTKQG